MSVLHGLSQIKMCWHRLGHCSVKHRCDGFSRGHMELLPSLPWTENADSAGRCSTYLLTHANDIIMTILVTSNQTPELRERERERVGSDEGQRNVQKSEEENDGGGGGRGIRWPLGHSLQVHRDRADSRVSRSHTCMSEIYCWVGGLMTPSWFLRINFTGMENCFFLEYEQHQRQENEGEKEGRRVVLSVLVCGVYSVAIHTHTHSHTLNLHEFSVHLHMSKPIQYAM